MPEINVIGIHKVKKRLSSGRIVEYHRVGRGSGAQTFWSSNSGIAVGSTEYLEALNMVTREARPSNNLFRGVIAQYLISKDFKKLSARYQKDIQYSISATNGIDERFGDAPLGAFNNPRIRSIALEWRDSFESDRVADERFRTLAKIVRWAYGRNLIAKNYLSDVKKLYSVDRSGVVWSEEIFGKFVAGAPDYVVRILIVATETGLRPGELVRLGHEHIFDTKLGREIRIVTNKKGTLAVLPVTQKMAGIIDATPNDGLPFLRNARGETWASANSLGDAVSEWRDRLNLPEVPLQVNGDQKKLTKLRLYDARGTAATRLLEAGAKLAQIASFMGWSIETAEKTIRSYARVNHKHSDDILMLLEGRKNGNM